MLMRVEDVIKDRKAMTIPAGPGGLQRKKISLCSTKPKGLVSVLNLFYALRSAKKSVR